MRVDLLLSVIARSSHSVFASSASVGKPPNTLGTCLTASGYKRRINVLRLKSAWGGLADTIGRKADVAW